MGGTCCFIDGFITAGNTFCALTVVKKVLVFVAVLGATNCFTSTTIVMPLHANVIQSVHVRICGGILDLPLDFFSRRHGKSVVTHVDTSIAIIRGSLADSVSVLVHGPVTLLIYFIALFSMD